MSLRFSVVPAPGQAGKYRAIVQSGSRVPFKKLLQRAAARTSISETDMKYAIGILAEQIVLCALDGDECDAGDMGRSRLGIRGTFDSPVPKRITVDDIEVTLSWTLSPMMIRQLHQRRSEIQLERVEPKPLAPIVSVAIGYLPTGEKLDNVWHAGSFFWIKGDNLKFNRDQADEGVFLTKVGTGETVRVSHYQRAALKNIICLVPAELAGAGELRLEVRRRPRANVEKPLVGEYGQTLEEIED